MEERDAKLIKLIRSVILSVLIAASIMILTMCKTHGNTQSMVHESTDCVDSYKDSVSQNLEFVKADEIIFEFSQEDKQEKSYLCDIIQRIGYRDHAMGIYNSNKPIIQNDVNESNNYMPKKPPDRILVKGLKAAKTNTDRNTQFEGVSKVSKDRAKEKKFKIDDIGFTISVISMITLAIVIILIYQRTRNKG